MAAERCAICDCKANGFYAWPISAHLCKRCAKTYPGSRPVKERSMLKMPGRTSSVHTEFARWRVKKAISVRALAAIVGCSPATITKLNRGEDVSGMVAKMLRSLFRDCPISKGEQNVYERDLTEPAAEFPTVMRKGVPTKRYLGPLPIFMEGDWNPT